MRTFIYCRVSTKEQSTQDHYSLDNQEQRCRDYLKMKRWTLVQLRKDVASGKNAQREGFQDLLASVKGGKVDVIIVYRLDRLSRNVRDIYDFLDIIKNSNVAFVSVTEGFDTTTAMGRAMLGVAAVFAQLTREMISENTKDGLLRRAESGLFLGNTTNVNGYDYDKELGRHVVSEIESGNIRQIFDWFTENKWGAEKIARMLNVQGSRTKSGLQWKPASIAKVLRNRIFAGMVRAGDNWVPGQHEAIISAEQFQQAQEIIAGRANLAPRSQHSPYLLSGLARCGKCGRSLRSHVLTQTRSDGTPQTHLFYRHPPCVTVGDKACKAFCKNAPRLEELVIAQIRQVAESGQLQKLALDEVRRRSGIELAPKAQQRDKLLLAISQLGDKFSQWADRLDAGKIDEEQFQQQNIRLLERKKALQKLLTSIEQDLGQQETLEVTFAEVGQALQEFPNVWDALEHEERQEMLRLLVEHLKVYSDHAELKVLFLEPVEISLNFKVGRKRKSTTQKDS